MADNCTCEMTPEDSEGAATIAALKKEMETNHVLVGRKDLLQPTRERVARCAHSDGEALREARREYEDELKKIRIHIGTLLKLDNVSFLVGAGCSLDAGGVSLATIPYKVEKAIIQAGRRGQGIRAWLRALYKCIATSAAQEVERETHPIRKRLLELLSDTPLDILKRQESLRDERVENHKDNTESVTADDLHTYLIPINLETLLARLYSWLAAGDAGRVILRFETPPARTITEAEITEAIGELRKAFLGTLRLPQEGSAETLNVHRDFLRKVLTRPVNLRRVHLFTLNNDTLLEQSADTEGVVMLDGFVGGLRRTFRPESYDQDMYFPAQTTEGRVHRLDRVVHLYKLHGSVTWRREEPSWHNPYGVFATTDETPADDALIYPTPLKYGEALGLPYSELFRRFGAAVVQPQSVLFVMGYGFGDEHVNALIRQGARRTEFQPGHSRS